MNPPPVRLGYLVSQYPAISHTFILREILALRDRGVSIDVASINSPHSRSQFTAEEQVEADQTFYVKQAGPRGALAALLWLLRRRPAALVAGLRAALRLGDLHPRQTLLALFYLAEAALLARWMHRRSLSHLHVHFATPAATVALLLTAIAPVTISITVHGPDEFYDVPGYHLPEKIAAARFVVCISFFAQSQLMKIAPPALWPRLDLSRLGVDCNHFLPRPSRPASPTINLLCVGRLVATKGQRILIETVHRLRQLPSLPPLHLRLIGDGPERAQLEALVRERDLASHITLEGAVNQDCIQAFYTEADIFTMASFAEGIPVVLMEAMAMEIPCVATGINGIPELIRDGIDGLLVPPSDIDGLAAALTRLTLDPSLRETLGRAGRLRVQQLYNVDTNADHLAALFRRRLTTLSVQEAPSGLEPTP